MMADRCPNHVEITNINSFPRRVRALKSGFLFMQTECNLLRLIEFLQEFQAHTNLLRYVGNCIDSLQRDVPIDIPGEVTKCISFINLEDARCSGSIGSGSIRKM